MSKKAAEKPKKKQCFWKDHNGGQCVFKLNKSVIEICRRLESDDSIENYIHFATLVHKVNLFLLEYSSIKAVENIVDIVFSEKLVGRIIDFITNTDYFCNFGIRLLEHFWIVDRVRKHLESSEIFYVMVGLLRTNDNETLVSALSFLSLILNSKNANIILSKARILPLLIKLLKTKDIEYVFFINDILMTILSDKNWKALRQSLINDGVMQTLEEIETSEDFSVLPDLTKKWSLIKRELEQIQKLTTEATK